MLVDINERYREMYCTLSALVRDIETSAGFQFLCIFEFEAFLSEYKK